MKNESVVLAGYYGFDNAGDELILWSLIQQLKKGNPACRVTVLSLRPERTRARYGVDAVNRWRIWEWAVPLWRADCFILGGGGLLQESTSPWSSAYYLLLLCIAKGLGCRTEVRAIGVDPIRHRVNRWWTRWVFHGMVDSVSVRDSDSRGALESAGVRGLLQVVPDPVFQLKRPPSSSIPSPFKRGGISIALSVSRWPQRPGWDRDVALLIDRAIDQLQARLELLVFFPEEDEALARKISERASHPVPVRTWNRPEELLSWMPDYSLVIGMRYHALALAALEEKPFVGWGSQRKVATLCREFGQPLWAFERGWDADAVWRQMGQAWRHRESLALNFKR